MGFNTVAVLLNDHSDKWPDDLRRAAFEWSPKPKEFREKGYFSGGTVLSVSHADHRQVVVAGMNGGALMSAYLPAEEGDLRALADVLEGHGYRVTKRKVKPDAR
jgi:hypothetical protein